MLNNHSTLHPWKQTKIILLFLRLHPSTVFHTLLLTVRATPISSKEFLPTAVDIMVIWIKCAHSHHFSSLIPKISMFTLAISFDHFQFALIHRPNIPGSYAILFFTASDFIFTSRHIRSWVLFPLWLSLFILSGAVFLLFPSSILDTY